MKTYLPAGKNDKQYGLANPGKAYVLYNASQVSSTINLTKFSGKFLVKIIDPKDGKVLKQQKINGNALSKIDKVGNGDEVIFINKI